jgi:hypothetical protein
MRNEGQPEVRIRGEAGGCRSHRGNSEPCGNRQRQKASEARGNPSGDRRHSRRDEEDGANHRNRTPAQPTGAEKGQPGTETQVEREDQGRRPTRNLISRLERSMDDPKCYRITVRKRQRPQGFWRFRLWGGFRRFPPKPLEPFRGAELNQAAWMGHPELLRCEKTGHQKKCSG